MKKWITATVAAVALMFSSVAVATPAVAAEKMSVAASTAASSVVLPTIKEGSKGPFVLMVQALLNDEHLVAPLTLDGVFGPKTKAAVVKYEKNEHDENLRTDGVVDSSIWKSITTVD